MYMYMCMNVHVYTHSPISMYRKYSISCTCATRKTRVKVKMSARGKYRSYTTKFKLEVVKYAVNNSKLAASKNSQKVGTNLV